MNSLSAYVITKDEVDLIDRCLDSLFALTPNILVLDSGSTDGTQARARSRGAIVEERPFDGFAQQRNHALDRIEEIFHADIVVTLDADEYFDAPSQSALASAIADGGFDVGLLRRRVIFMGRELRFGNRANVVLPRVFRSGLRYENREVNEHIEVPVGSTISQLDVVIMHDDRATWSELIRKHADYAEREGRIRRSKRRARLSRPPKERHLRNRWLREQVYERTPGKVPLAFLFQYFVRRGFLDGRPGLDRAVLDAFTEYSIDHHARSGPATTADRVRPPSSAPPPESQRQECRP